MNAAPRPMPPEARSVVLSALGAMQQEARSALAQRASERRFAGGVATATSPRREEARRRGERAFGLKRAGRARLDTSSDCGDVAAECECHRKHLDRQRWACDVAGGTFSGKIEWDGVQCRMTGSCLIFVGMDIFAPCDYDVCKPEEWGDCEDEGGVTEDDDEVQEEGVDPDFGGFGGSTLDGDRSCGLILSGQVLHVETIGRYIAYRHLYMRYYETVEMSRVFGIDFYPEHFTAELSWRDRWGDLQFEWTAPRGVEPRDIHPSTVHENVPIPEGSCVRVKRCLQKEGLRIHGLRLPYRPLGPNSNTGARQLLRACGLPERLPGNSPVDQYPGWDHAPI